LIATILGKEYTLSPLEAAGIVCYHVGYTDVDAQPTGIGTGWVITASSPTKGPIKGHGRSQKEACLDIIKKVSNG
jgi:hypothetical protein